MLFPLTVVSLPSCSIVSPAEIREIGQDQKQVDKQAEMVAQQTPPAPQEPQTLQQVQQQVGALEELQNA